MRCQNRPVPGFARVSREAGPLRAPVLQAVRQHSLEAQRAADRGKRRVQRVAVRDFCDGSVVWLQPCPANLATVTIDRTGTALAVASGPNYFAGSNKVTVVKQHDLEPREFSFGNVPLFAAGCQHFEPNAQATVLHAVIDTAADHMGVCLAAHFPPVIVVPGQPA